MPTSTLIRNVLSTDYNEIPRSVIYHAKQSLLNWLGVTIGASYHESVDMVLALKDDFKSGEQVSILGRSEKADLSLAALINGMSSHIFDYDDTHLDTIHHPSGPVAPVVFSLSEWMNLSGKDVLKSYILGCEVELRLSNAIYPSHYTKGWHITSTVGNFGSGIAAGLLLDLDENQLHHTLGIAGTQASGLRGVFGTMCKPFHPGKSAQNGLISAILAKKGFTSVKNILEAKRGFANVMAPEHDLTKLNALWGEVWELQKNSFKPYACGIVLHPVIDACIALRKYAVLDDVEEIILTVNPYVLELTGIVDATTGLEGKFSVFHTSSIAFIDGDASQDQYSDEKVLDPVTSEFRKKITPIINENINEDEAHAKLKLKNGKEFTHYIKHATGSIENPMNQEQLEKKFRNLTVKIIGDENATNLIDEIMNLESKNDINEIIRFSTTNSN